MHFPLIVNQYDSGSSLGYATNVATAGGLVTKIPGSIWSAVNTAFDAGATILSMALAQDGTLYVGGLFTNIGDANGDYIVKIAVDGTISSMGTGANNTKYPLR
jgi:hypothetical protein